MILGTEGFAVNGLQFSPEIFKTPIACAKSPKNMRLSKSIGCPKVFQGFVGGPKYGCPMPYRESPLTITFINDI